MAFSVRLCSSRTGEDRELRVSVIRSRPRSLHMMRTVLAVAALPWGGLLSTPSEAHGRRRGTVCDVPCPPTPVCYVEKPVTCYKPVWVERQVPTTVCRVVQREVPYTYTVQVPVWTPTKQTVTGYKQVN